MKHLLCLFITLVLTTLFSTAWARPSPTIPEFPKQPHTNAAISQLIQAQKKVGSNNADAIVHLKKAGISVEKSAKNKGSFRGTAIRLIGQAVKHLEKNELEVARKEITDALEAVYKAGEAAAR